MKTIQLKNKTIERVGDDQAYELVSAGKATYVAKNIWKREVRDKA